MTLPVAVSLTLLYACSSPPAVQAPEIAQAPHSAAAPEDAPKVELGLPITEKASPAHAPKGGIVLGYFTNWAHYRKAPCNFKTADIDARLFTHINYSFALIKADESKELYQVIPSNPEDESRLFAEVNALKKDNPGLKTFLSIGGWAFNDEPTAWIFSAMAETKERRGSFIRHAAQYARKHGFDGIDIDWEFPGAPDRGGRRIDTENYTSLLREFRAHFEQEAKDNQLPELLLTIAAPAGPHFRQHMQLDKIHPWLNWINLMTYDYHGNWEKKTGANAPLQGEEVSVSSSVSHFKKMGVPAEKLVMGFATYARGWTGVETASPGAAATGPAPVGPCGKESFAAHQVEALVKEGKYQAFWDENTKTPFAYSKEEKAYLTFDNERSVGLKLETLKREGLAGGMFWAIDLDNFKRGFPMITQVSKAVKAPD